KRIRLGVDPASIVGASPGGGGTHQAPDHRPGTSGRPGARSPDGGAPHVSARKRAWLLHPGTARRAGCPFVTRRRGRLTVAGPRLGRDRSSGSPHSGSETFSRSTRPVKRG